MLPNGQVVNALVTTILLDSWHQCDISVAPDLAESYLLFVFVCCVPMFHIHGVKNSANNWRIKTTGDNNNDIAQQLAGLILVSDFQLDLAIATFRIVNQTKGRPPLPFWIFCTLWKWSLTPSLLVVDAFGLWIYKWWHRLASNQQWKSQISKQVSHIWGVAQFCFAAWVALFYLFFFQRE